MKLTTKIVITENDVASLICNANESGYLRSVGLTFGERKPGKTLTKLKDWEGFCYTYPLHGGYITIIDEETGLEHVLNGDAIRRGLRNLPFHPNTLTRIIKDEADAIVG